MKRSTWRKQHKWWGIGVGLFLLMFCISGILLNHRSLLLNQNISRRWLPPHYQYTNWNQGLLRGTVAFHNNSGEKQVLLYGNQGLWRLDSLGGNVTDFNRGLPKGADYRQIKALCQLPGGEWLALSPFRLYRYKNSAQMWVPVATPLPQNDAWTDMLLQGDSLLLLSRSHLYIASENLKKWKKHSFRAPENYTNKVSLFRTVWLLHTGEIAGTTGKIVVDAVAVILIFITLTGWAYWLLPKYIRAQRKKGKNTKRAIGSLQRNRKWHKRLGTTTIVLTLFVAITGWCLRPPVLIFLATHKTPPIPRSELDSPNPWHDKLRMIRYDAQQQEWLISTSEGFWSLKTLQSLPEPLKQAPPVSVMGLNVWRPENHGQWLCGSFSGLYVWDRASGKVTDWFTGEVVKETAGPPFGKRAVAGVSADFGNLIVAEYDNGTTQLQQPQEMKNLPMSVWNVALEIHTGRIYIGNIATYIFIFLVGGGIVWSLWSGWRLRN